MISRVGEALPRECQHPDTGPVYSAFYDSHPPASLRMRICSPWHNDNRTLGENHNGTRATLLLYPSPSALAVHKPHAPGRCREGKAVQDKQCVACLATALHTRDGE